MTWTSPAPDPAPDAVEGPMTGADRPMLTGYLAWQRSTLLNICAGLTGEQLAAQPFPPSVLSLLGLVRHLIKVERVWLRVRAGGEDVELTFPLGDDQEFRDLRASDAAVELMALQDEWRRADAAVAELDFEHPVRSREDTLSLRMVYVHLIGEYARHNGHADLLREAIDGTTGR